MANRKIQAVLAQMQKNLECSICLEMMKNPISTACGHQFCRFCIMEFLERKKQVPCPLCKKNVTKRGLMEREQLGQMVSDVHKLIEAYQADTGTLFSPPRGSSMNMLPSTPESIKPKPSDQPTVRQMNTRRSSQSNVVEKRKSLPKIVKRETSRITRDGKTSTAKQKMEPCAKEENTDSPLVGSNKNLQQLLDVIETGTHGAVNNNEITKTCSSSNNDSLVSKNMSNSVNEKNLEDIDKVMEENDVNCRHNLQDTNTTDALRVSSNDGTNVDMNIKESELIDRGENSDKNDEQRNGCQKASIDQHQSGVSNISQNSSEDVVSLFSTPLDIKQMKQNQKKKSSRTTRSQRYKALSVAEDDKKDNNELTSLTPDNEGEKNVFTPEFEPIKTYSKKGTLDKDNKSKRKVSDWLKNLQNTDESKENDVPVKKQLSNREFEVKINPKNMKAIQQREAVMGQRIRKFADTMKEADEKALFGFEGLDSIANPKTDKSMCSVEANLSGTTQGNKYVTDKEAEHSVDMEDKFSRLEKDEINGTETDEINRIENVEINVIEKDEMNIKEKVEINVIDKDDTNSIPKHAVVDEHERKQDTSNEDKKVSENKPMQRKRIFKSKQVVSKAKNKSDYKENPQLSIQEIPMEPVKTGADKQKPMTVSKKQNRLLQLSDSPITNTSANSDPYEFRSSQKTPQKPKSKASKKKGGRTKNNKSKPLVEKMKQNQAPQTRKVPSSKIDRSIHSQNGSKINKIMEDLNQAEDFDLLTSTQEVLMNMKDIDNKNKGNESNIQKKKVRFKEPSLSDFISPGKIDVHLYRTEKQSYEKLTLQTNKISSKEYRNLSVNIGKTDETKESKTNKQTEKNMLIHQKEETFQNDHDNDSDDLSEDFRFHDDSSGTDDLDINPEQDEFEPPNIDCQPEEIKEQIVEKGKLSINSVETETKQPSPEMSCVMDTPQVSMRTLSKDEFAFPVQPCKSNSIVATSEQETPQIVVAETPLICMGELESDLGGKEVLVRSDFGNSNSIRAQTNTDMTSESPVPAKVDNDKIEKNMDTNTESNIVLNSCENLGLEEIGETSSIESVPLNMDISTLEENDEQTSGHTESKSYDTVDFENASETLIATKIATDGIELIENTDPGDETQSPNGFQPEVLEIITNTDTGNLKELLNEEESDQPNVVESLGCSQSSVSVLEMNRSQIEIADKVISGNGLENSELRKVSDEDSGNKSNKSVRKKRKCFMLEDTQEIEQAVTNHSSPCANKSKKQKVLSRQSEDVVQGTEENISKTLEVQQRQDIHVVSYDGANKTNTHTLKDPQDIVLISQNSVEMESPRSKERHLSGILISPTERTGDYQSPEDIFCIESEMPAVALSPEEETQCTDEIDEIVSTNDSSSQRTHVSETQKSLIEDNISDFCDKKRKDGVRASRGFSKRIKTSEEEVSTDTPKTKIVSTPKSTSSQKLKISLATSPKTAVTTSPKPQIISTPKTPKTNFKSSKDNRLPTVPVNDFKMEVTSDVEIVTATDDNLSTTAQRNAMKFKSPVVGLRSLTSSPSLVNSPSLAIRISKYSPGIRNTLPIPLSLKEKRQDVQKENCVEVVELNKRDTYKLNSDTSSSMDEDIVDETDCSLLASNKTQSKKKSPKLRLQLSSKEKPKMIESAQTTQDKNCFNTEENNKPLEENSIPTQQNAVDHCVINENNDSETLTATGLPSEERKKDVIYSPEGFGDKSCDKTGKKVVDDQIDNLNVNHDLLSSPDFELNESDQKVLNDCKRKVKTNQDVLESCRSDSTKTDFAGSFKPFPSLDLDFDTSESEDDEAQREIVHKDQKKNNQTALHSFELDAEVVEESDLDEDSFNDITTYGQQDNKGKVVNKGKVDQHSTELKLGSKSPKGDTGSESLISKQDQDADELRTVKQIRPRRAILSDSESDADDESLKLDYTSSSAFSSQSENLTTQEREKLENDLEKMAAEMAQLKEQLNRGKTGENKDSVVILDDNDDDVIEADTSDVEMTHEPCYSPPPYSPVIMSQQEKSLDNISYQNEEMDIEVDAQYIDLNDTTSISAGVRQPLKDIDINIQRDQTNKTVRKKVLGFLATGLSSAQVIEVKKLAAVNDVQFYMKMCPSVTHVIVKPADEDMKTCDRTLKFFQGIAHKCWVVSYQWIVDSKESGNLLSEVLYEIQGDSTMGSSHQGPKRSRLSKEDLFTGIHFSLFGNNKHLNQDCISDLIETCGGIVVDENKLAECGRKTLVICCTDVEDENTQCEHEVVQKSREIKKKYGVLTLKRDWIMDSLTTFKLQPTKLYTV